MKTKRLLAVVAVITCCVTVGFGQSNVVFYGADTNAIGISFVDTNLSVSARASIVADLQLCLQAWGKGTQFRLGADDPAFVAHLYNPDTTPYYPETIDFPDNVVSNGIAGYSLQIPKTLSDAYTNAFAFAAANSNIVAAAYEFVAFVSSTNFASLPSNALPNYLMQKGVSAEEIIADAQESISELRHQAYYPPSILGFHYSGRGPSATNLWVRVPCSIDLSYIDAKGWNAFPAVWHDEKWKFCVWPD